MFHMLHLFISSHLHILMFLDSCALACIFASSYPYVHVYLPESWHLTSSYPQVRVPLLASLHPHIGMFVYACLYLCTLTTSYPQVLKCLLVSLYSCILSSSYPYVRVYLLISSDSYILISLSSCDLAYPHILSFVCACL